MADIKFLDKQIEQAEASKISIADYLRTQHDIKKQQKILNSYKDAINLQDEIHAKVQDIANWYSSQYQYSNKAYTQYIKILIDVFNSFYLLFNLTLSKICPLISFSCPLFLSTFILVCNSSISKSCTPFLIVLSASCPLLFSL